MTTRQVLCLLVVLVFMAAVPLAAVAQPERPAQVGQLDKQSVERPASAAPDPNEPNDTPSQATPVELPARLLGILETQSDVDYFSFTAAGGNTIMVEVDANELGSTADVFASLYASDGVTVLATDDNSAEGNDPRIVYTLPADGEYYVALSTVTGAAANAFYYATFATADIHEPNNRISRATELSAGIPIDATIDPDGDLDYYWFEAKAGEKIALDIDAVVNGSSLDTELLLYDRDGLALLAWGEYDEGNDARITYQIPADGIYYLLVADSYYHHNVPYNYYTLTLVTEKLLLSAAVSGKVQGIDFTPGDVLWYDPITGEWGLYFDASDLGIKANVTAIDIYSGGDLLLSFGSKVTLSDSDGVPFVATPQDIVAFDGSTGADTSGSFYMVSSGRFYQLGASSEAIDAIDGTRERSWINHTWCDLVGGCYEWQTTLSTKGGFFMPNFACQGKNNTLFDLYSGKDNSGWYDLCYTWTIPLQGIESENITGLASTILEDGMFFTVANGYHILDISGDANDILRWNWYTDELNLYWDGRAHGFPFPIDGLAFER